MSGSLNILGGQKKSRTKGIPVGKSPYELIPFAQGTLSGGGPGSFEDILFELRRAQQENPALSAAGGLYGQVAEGLDSLEASPDPRAALLREASLTGTDRAASAGVLLAREAGAGRGGLAFGTGAGELARRTASETAVGQSQALSQAVLGAEQLREDRNRFLAAARQELAAGRLQEAGLIARRRERALSVRQNFLQLMAQIASAGTAGIGGAVRTSGRSKGPYQFGLDFGFSMGGAGGSGTTDLGG